ncbi:hypothetical protein IT402_02065 [Candidatus Nomurabacteria bacterium]|nr:hypothetical protein [Candidatus Nomurabacteria bacterium]
MISFNKKQKGFFLIEVVVATAVAATVVIFLLGLVQNTVRISAAALERTQASYLLEEGQEATKTIRDGGWSNISLLSNGTNYYFLWSGSEWTLNTTPSSVDSFTRTISFEEVYRDVNDDIASSGGTLDTRTRKGTVTVSWTTSSGSSKSESLTFYIADIRT